MPRKPRHKTIPPQKTVLSQVVGVSFFAFLGRRANTMVTTPNANAETVANTAGNLNAPQPNENINPIHIPTDTYMNIMNIGILGIESANVRLRASPAIIRIAQAKPKKNAVLHASRFIHSIIYTYSFHSPTDEQTSDHSRCSSTGNGTAKQWHCYFLGSWY
jgi:hypothetical protein